MHLYKQWKKRIDRKGFTLVELSLSLAFIGILSILIVLVINSAISSYRRGITLNLINTVGSEVVDDIRTAVQGSVKEETDDVPFFASMNMNIKVDGKQKEVPAYGAFCTGSYTYVWNSGYLFEFEDLSNAFKLTLRDKNNNQKDGFRLLKIKNEGNSGFSVCEGLDKGGAIKEIEIEGNLNDISEELLSGSEDGSVVVYDLFGNKPVSGPGGLFYSISLRLGTRKSGMNINSNNCIIPEEGEGNLDYCAINIFSFSALAKGGL